MTRCNLNDLFLFVQAVDSGSFAAAGRRLGLPKSTVSKRVAELEASLGARLVHRTSRSFALTPVGRDFHEHARASVIEAQAAEEVVRSRQAEPSGVVRITASVPTAQFQLAGQLPALIQAYPRLTVQLHVTDRFVDLIQESFDIAVRSHFAPLPDSGLVQRRMCSEALVLVASPGYVKTRGTPSGPEALSAHAGLMVGPSSTLWRLNDGRGRVQEARPVARLFADESVVLLQSAIAGLGIACLPEPIVANALSQGALIRVLQPWTAGTVDTTLLTPYRRSLLPAVRVVMDFLCAAQGTG
jgi:DNA-binding transcriptional LysR family regulator